MRNPLAPTALLALALLASPAFAQMGGGGMWSGPGDHMTNGSEALIVPAGVRGDGKNGARVNATVVNTTATTVTGTLEVVDADGSAPAGTGPKSWPFRIAGYSSTQVDDVLAAVSSRFPSGGAGLQLRVRLDRSAGGMVMAYAVVNDNLTNDGYVVMGSMMNAGLGMGSGQGMGH